MQMGFNAAAQCQSRKCPWGRILLALLQLPELCSESLRLSWSFLPPTRVAYAFQQMMLSASVFETGT